MVSVEQGGGFLKFLKMFFVLIFLLCVSVPAFAAPVEPITFADYGWDLVRFHDRVAGLIIENGYEKKVEQLFVEHIAGLVGLEKGDIDIYMDLWPNNCKEWWDNARDNGSVVKLSVNYDGGSQGWYVPTFVIKGDPERGIEPMAPDLKSVNDLAKYWELFRDPEVKDKGRFLNGPPSWMAYGVNMAKLQVYGLDKYFVSFPTGGTTVLIGEVIANYKKGKPVLFYFWDPTWLMGLYDFTLLEEPPFDMSLWNQEEGYACEWVKGTSFIVANSGFVKREPEVAAFLSRYQTTLDQNRKALLYIHDNESDADLAARWFLKNYRDHWHQWIPTGHDGVIERVEAALRKYE